MTPHEPESQALITSNEAQKLSAQLLMEVELTRRPGWNKADPELLGNPVSVHQLAPTDLVYYITCFKVIINGEPLEAVVRINALQQAEGDRYLQSVLLPSGATSIYLAESRKRVLSKFKKPENAQLVWEFNSDSLSPLLPYYQLEEDGQVERLRIDGFRFLARRDFGDQLKGKDIISDPKRDSIDSIVKKNH
ncbi:MAG: hypothetical protein HXX08_23160 [Chloroflexi bacterium]|uniref:Uncharacterized protein n=1 Tax=Candidatus Chlorohelix allophototropha TaxID=3003348 RepID=A0A8T7M9H6_9CHLR|nr:hypothetical protein [Chloroflexota bacterium]WJW68704.1 hypothetical protein OZ401_004320 [Chloroflexota bacterium L227-S17]